MVTRVQGHIARPPELVSLLHSLPLLGSGEQTPSRDAGLDEGTVIRTARERSGIVLEALAVKMGLKQLLNGGAPGADLLSGLPAIEDATDVVGGADHVKIQVDGNVGQLGRGEVVNIVVGSQKAIL